MSPFWIFSGAWSTLKEPKVRMSVAAPTCPLFLGQGELGRGCNSRQEGR